MNFLIDFIASKTVGLALTLVPLLSSAFNAGHADEWIYKQLPKPIKDRMTLAEMHEVLSTGKAFMKACFDATRK